MTLEEFRKDIAAGIPDVLPQPKAYEPEINHAPKRKEILTAEEKELALRNALRYFPKKHHAELAPEFAEELRTYGRIYMYRLRPDYEMKARNINDYPAIKSHLDQYWDKLSKRADKGDTPYNLRNCAYVDEGGNIIAECQNP